MKRYYRDNIYEIPNDWPSGPKSSFEDTIEELADFPKETKFYKIESNNVATLFSVDQVLPKMHSAYNSFFVAIFNKCFSEGVQLNTFTDCVIDKNVIHFPLGYFRITDNGHRLSTLSRLTLEMTIHPIIDEVYELIVFGKYDTAIREASVRLENRIRVLCSASDKLFGINLIKELFKNAPVTEETHEIHLKYQEKEFRKFFSYVRNKFAHNVVNTDMATTICLIAKCSTLYLNLHAVLGYPRDKELYKYYK